MKKKSRNNYWYRIKPYLFLSLAALAAFLPVTSMLFSLRNDVLAIEYPVQHFISEAIRNGENPVWFNTWCMGFPLQSVLTWSIFSTPRSFIGAILPSDVLVLHAEFLFYTMSAGWVMYALLKDHFSTSRNLSLLLATCYMLSGFTVGSSQWLLYITGLSFIPLVIYCSLNLLKKPSAISASFFAVSFLLLLTNVHIYLTVFTSYGLVLFFSVHLLKAWLGKQMGKQERNRLFRFTALALLLTLLLSAAPLYFTAELIKWLERSNPLLETSDFFRSNYLHPAELKSLLLPLSTVKSSHYNTEGSVQNIYIGLLPLLLFIPSLINNQRNKNSKAWWLLLTAFFFLLLSFGHLTPLRGWLNLLPGLSYFRHPAVLRVFFVMALIIYLGSSFGDSELKDIVQPGTTGRKYLLYTLGLFALVVLVLILANAGTFEGLWKGSLYESKRSVQNKQLVLLNSTLQLLFILLILFSALKKQSRLTSLFVTELVMNFLACTPFYSVSSYPAKEVNSIFSYTRGFPVQQTLPYNVPAEYTDPNGTTWRNTNTFRKEVSTEVSMPGPVILGHTGKFLSSPEKAKLRGKQLVFINGEAAPGDSLRVNLQKPGRVRASVSLSVPQQVVLQQSYFPGWRAYYNGNELPLVKNDFPFVTVLAPAGRGELEFRFQKKGLMYSALFLHLVVLTSLIWVTRRKIFLKSSSPS